MDNNQKTSRKQKFKPPEQIQITQFAFILQSVNRAENLQTWTFWFIFLEIVT